MANKCPGQPAHQSLPAIDLETCRRSIIFSGASGHRTGTALLSRALCGLGEEAGAVIQRGIVPLYLGVI